MCIKQIALCAGMALACAGACSLHAADRLMPGLWENKITTDGRTTTRTRCVTAEEANSKNLPPKAMREAAEKALAKTSQSTCKITEFKVDGNTITQTVVCPANTYSNTTTFRADTFESTSKTTTGGVSKLTFIKGQRVGACPAVPAEQSKP
jgi:hypothetical protein